MLPIRAIRAKGLKITSRPAERRLIEALATLAAAPSRTPQRPTLSTLCRLARVSRNTLYRYYPDVAAKARQLRSQHGRVHASREGVIKALHVQVAGLRDQVAKLAALADHYFAAAEEQRALLARRDRELAALKSGLRPARIPR